MAIGNDGEKVCGGGFDGEPRKPRQTGNVHGFNGAASGTFGQAAWPTVPQDVLIMPPAKYHADIAEASKRGAESARMAVVERLNERSRKQWLYGSLIVVGFVLGSLITSVAALAVALLRVA